MTSIEASTDYARTVAVALLTSLGFPPAEVIVGYNPRINTDELDLGELLLFVTPRSATPKRETRKRQLDEVKIDLALVQRLAPDWTTADLDGLTHATNKLARAYLGERAFPQGMRTVQTDISIYEPQALDQHAIYQGVVQVTFTVDDEG